MFFFYLFIFLSPSIEFNDLTYVLFTAKDVELISRTKIEVVSNVILKKSISLQL